MKTYSDINKKLATQRNRRIFLLECKRKNITPTFVENSCKHFWTSTQQVSRENTNALNSLTQQVTRKLRNITLRDTISYLGILETRKDFIVSKLRGLLPYYIAEDFLYYQNRGYDRIFNKIKNINIRKIKALEKKSNDLYSSENVSWFRNVSNVTIPTAVQGFLALGPKFSLPITPTDINMFKLISEVESIIQYIPIDEQNLIRSKVTNTITHYFHANINNKPPTSEILSKTKKFLKDHPDLIVTKSDKGNVTVAMNKEDYIEKSNLLLNDIETYKLINKDPTTSVETSCNKLIKTLKDKKYITQETAKNLITYNGTCPKYYGLPKVHKPDVPLRPIVSCIGASTQPLAKFVSNILELSFRTFNKFRIKDTFDFAERINNKRLPQGFALVSFDVVSLFTNIPLDLVIDTLNKHFNLIEPNTIVPKSEFLKIVTYLYNNTFFSFNNKFYHQIRGLPMGGAASPVIAEVIMNELLYYITDTANFEFPFIFQYVDDLITAVPEDKIHSTLNLFNSFNEHLAFTVEEETDRSVPFLDTKVVRNKDNLVILDWYRKQSSSGRYIPFTSYHPYKQKINAVIALKGRIEKICHPSFLQKNLQQLKEILINNKYPKSLINKILFSNRNDNHHHNNNITNQLNNNINQNIYVKLQYIHNLTPILSKIFSKYSITVAQYNTKKINQLYTNLKDKVATLQKSYVIYCIECECGQVYIGQTSQKLTKRLALHKSDCKHKPLITSLSSHVNSADHRVKYNETVILDTETNTFKRKILEMCYIHNCDNCLNQKKDIEGLSSIYTYLLSNTFTKNLKTPDIYIQKK